MKTVPAILAAAAGATLLTNGLTPAAATAAPAVASPSPAAAHSTRITPDSNCGDDVAVYAPPGGGWGSPSYGTCGHISSGKNPTNIVSWYVPWWSDGEACARARGYAWGTGKAFWQSLGCGTGGSVAVHWGKSGVGALSTNEVELESFATPLTGVPGEFGN